MSGKAEVDGAVLAANAFVLRFFDGQHGDRLLLVNLGLNALLAFQAATGGIPLDNAAHLGGIAYERGGSPVGSGSSDSEVT